MRQSNHQLRLLVGFGADLLVHSVVLTVDLVTDYTVVLMVGYAVDKVVDSAVGCKVG